jgi:hypothetical protein
MGASGRSLNDPFANDKGVTTEVHIPSLEKEVERLKDLRDYVKTKLIPHLATVATTIKDGKVAFGGFAQAQSAYSKHDMFFQTVMQAYADLVKQLDDDVQATQAVIDNYKSADARNNANAGDIDKLFHYQPGGGGGTYSSGTTPTTTTSNGSGL